MRRRILYVSCRQLRNVTAALLLGPALEGLDRHVADPESRQHPRDVSDQRVVEDDDEHLVGAEPLRILECQVREPVEPDGGLAATGTALNDDEPRRGLADQLELPGVDERRDLGEVLVFSQILVADPELPGTMMGLGTHGSPLPARELGREISHPPPQVLARTSEGPLRRPDPPELAACDR